MARHLLLMLAKSQLLHVDVADLLCLGTDLRPRPGCACATVPAASDLADQWESFQQDKTRRADFSRCLLQRCVHVIAALDDWKKDDALRHLQLNNAIRFVERATSEFDARKRFQALLDQSATVRRGALAPLGWSCCDEIVSPAVNPLVHEPIDQGQHDALVPDGVAVPLSPDELAQVDTDDDAGPGLPSDDQQNTIGVGDEDMMQGPVESAASESSAAVESSLYDLSDLGTTPDNDNPDTFSQFDPVGEMQHGEFARLLQDATWMDPALAGPEVAAPPNCYY